MASRPGDTHVRLPPDHRFEPKASRNPAARGRARSAVPDDVPPGRAGECREALRRVTADLLPGSAAGDALAHVTWQHGLPDLDAIAVVDHTGERPVVVGTSSASVLEALGLEIRLGQGPVSACAATGEAVVCRDLRHDRRWTAFGRTADAPALPFRRWAVLPMGLPGERPVGSLVLAAVRPGIVTPAELATIGSLADRGSLTLTAHLGAGREARAVLAMDDVRVVAIAVGRLMEAHGLTEAEALTWLRDRQEATGTRLVDVATPVAEASPSAGPRGHGALADPAAHRRQADRPLADG